MAVTYECVLDRLECRQVGSGGIREVVAGAVVLDLRGVMRAAFAAATQVTRMPCYYISPPRVLIMCNEPRLARLAIPAAVLQAIQLFVRLSAEKENASPMSLGLIRLLHQASV